MDGTIYIYFEGFEIGVALSELNIDARWDFDDTKVFERAIAHLDSIGVPYKTFPGYKEYLSFDVCI